MMNMFVWKYWKKMLMNILCFFAFSEQKLNKNIWTVICVSSGQIYFETFWAGKTWCKDVNDGYDDVHLTDCLLWQDVHEDNFKLFRSLSSRRRDRRFSKETSTQQKQRPAMNFVLSLIKQLTHKLAVKIRTTKSFKRKTLNTLFYDL